MDEKIGRFLRNLGYEGWLMVLPHKEGYTSIFISDDDQMEWFFRNGCKANWFATGFDRFMDERKPKWINSDVPLPNQGSLV